MGFPTTDSQLLADDLVWAESPRWRDDRIWVSDTQGARLVVLGGEDERRDHPLAGAVNGTGFLPTGDLVAARMTGARLDRFDGQDWSLHADLTDWVQGTLGDLLVLSDGTVLVDEVRGPDRPGRLLRVAPPGSEEPVTAAAEDLVFPNGLVIVDDGATLVVAETFAGRLTAFTIDDAGRLTDRRLWFDLRAELGETFLPDGACPGPDGSVWVAATTGQAFVRIADGVLIDRIDVDGFAIACCSGPAGELVLTTANSLDPGLSIFEAAHQQRTRASVTCIDPSITDDHR